MTASNTISATSRVWIYQSSKPFPKEEIIALNLRIQSFCKSWVSHSNQLKASGSIYYDRFIVLMVDESQAGASGCSIDKSTHFIQSLEREYGVDMFDRMNFAYLDGDTVKTAYREEFMELYKNGSITDETLVFDNLVKTKAAFDTAWKKPLSSSWHKKLM